MAELSSSTFRELLLILALWGDAKYSQQLVKGFHNLFVILSCKACCLDKFFCAFKYWKYPMPNMTDKLTMINITPTNEWNLELNKLDCIIKLPKNVKKIWNWPISASTLLFGFSYGLKYPYNLMYTNPNKTENTIWSEVPGLQTLKIAVNINLRVVSIISQYQYCGW